MASIIRNSIARNAHVVARHNIAVGRVVQPALSSFVRFNSSQTAKPPLNPEALMKQVLEKHGGLKRDDEGRTVSYDELLPITRSPSPVSLSSQQEGLSELNLVL